MASPTRRATLWPCPDLYRWFATIVGLTMGVAAALGCSAPCEGDHVLVDGTCVPRCNDAACSDGLACVHSVCRPTCKRDSDCKGADVCESIKTDQGKSGKYCFGLAVHPSPYETQPEPSTTVYVDPDQSAEPDGACKQSSDCVQSVPHHCVDGECRTACTLHEHCGQAGVCTGGGKNTEGEQATYCQADDFPRAEGQYGSTCLSKTSSCDADAGFQCISAGDGDVDSYCTRAGCDGDEDCPSGLACTQHRVSSRPPCEAACGLDGRPNASNCVPKAEIGDGRAFRCGATGGLVLSLCLERSFCSPCETDADCRGRKNQVCARGADGEKTCTVLCNPSQGGCPWGQATECAVFDNELGVPTCGHRFGACRSSGKSCEPCTHDGDCPSGFCARSEFSGELFCYDQSAECQCAAGESICVGGGCPTAPSGKPMNCVSTGEGAPPSACYGAEIDEAGGTPLGCW